ncbi:hypothetical protein [Mucilaginibacter sp.]
MNDINQQLKDAQASAGALEQRLIELNKTIAELNNGQGELDKVFRDFAKNLNEGAGSLKKIEEALKKANLQFDRNAAVLNQSNGSLNQNKAVLNGLLEQYELLSREQGDHSKGLQALNVKIGQLSNTIEDQEQKLLKSREVFSAHKQSVEYLGSSMDTLKGKAGELGPGFATALEGAAGGFNAMKRDLIVYN